MFVDAKILFALESRSIQHFATKNHEMVVLNRIIQQLLEFVKLARPVDLSTKIRPNTFLLVSLIWLGRDFKPKDRTI